MANLMTTLLASNENFVKQHMNELNATKAFPVKTIYKMEQFVEDTRDDSLVISGGTDKERTGLLLALLRCTTGCVVMLHNGNPYLDLGRIHKYAIDAYNWDENIYAGFSEDEMLSALVSEEKDKDLAVFYTFALDLCEALGKPKSIQGMKSIDWKDATWQSELLYSGCDTDKAMDLIKRYDKDMAARAARARSMFEKLTRSGSPKGITLSDAIANENVIVKEVFGSSSAICKQCLELIQTKAETGEKFTLILDDIYLDTPIIKEKYPNVRLILVNEDITQCDKDMKFVKRRCSLVCFRHVENDSCKAISEKYFGEYDCLQSEIAVGVAKAIFQPKTVNKAIHIAPKREARLKANMIMEIPFGNAVIHTQSGLEGRIIIA